MSNNPVVSLNLNSIGDGGVAVFTGEARLSPEDGDMSTNPRYVDKYRSLIEGELATSVEAVATAYRVAIRVKPNSLRYLVALRLPSAVLVCPLDPRQFH